MRKVRFPLLIKILLVVITIILVVGSGTAWLTFIKTKDVLLGYQKDSITKLTVEEAEEMVGNLEHSVLFTKMIAGQAKMAEYLTRPGNKNLHKELVDIFDRYQREYPEYLAVYLMDPSGKTLISSDRSFVGQDYSFREYFKQAITGKEYTEAQVGITSRQLGFYFSAPVFTFDKSKILGVVVAKLREEAISQELLGHEITKVGQVMLTNREGKIFIAQKKDRRLLDLEKIGYSEVLNKLKNYRGHIELVNFYDKADKEQELVLIARVGQTPFYLVVETVDDDLEAAVLPTAWTIGLGVLVASILALLAIMLVVVMLLSPLKQVRFFAQEFGPGNFGLRLQINSSDEIGEIATLLNKMAGEIESLYSQMEEKIKLRTSDLEKAKIALLNVMEDITREKQNLVKFEMAVAET